MFFDIAEALMYMDDPFRMEEARIYLAQNASMDDLYGYGLAPHHMQWFNQNHRTHHYGMGGMGYGRQETIVQERRDLFGNEEEVITTTDGFGDIQQTVIEEDNSWF